ncbi:hypothetical protein RCL1_008855 [Eukaryota sp. TZLM3-RCL]
MDCCVCLQGFDSSTRVPYIICCNNHSVCKSCYPQLRKCPFCRSNVLPNPQPNRDLAQLVSAVLRGDFIETISPSELENPLNDRIGSGGFGCVYANSWMGSDVAVKVVDLTEDGKRRLRREVAFISRLNHPSVIRVFGICEFADKIGIVMDRGDGCLPIPSLLSRTTLKYAMDIVNAVKFLHSKQVVHGDLKPDNILLVDNKIKLTDFGTARTISTSSMNPTVFAATPKYAPLESFDGKCYPQSDVYSIGIILYEILCNKIAFDGDSVVNIMGKKYTNYVPPFDDSDHPELKRIITECCNKDENSRPTLDAISSVLKSLLTVRTFEVDMIESSISRLAVVGQNQRHPSRHSTNLEVVTVAHDNSLVSRVHVPRDFRRRAEEHCNRGLDLCHQDKFNEALEAFDAAIHCDPNYVDAHHGRGVVLEKLQRFNIALEAFDAAIRIDLNYVHAHHGRGVVLEKLQRFNEALEAYDAAIRVYPNYVHAHHGRGVVLEKLQRFNEALEAYDAAIRVDPNYVDAHHGRGVVLEKLQRFNEALEAYDTAIRIDPNIAEAHASRASVLSELNRKIEALAAYDNALRIDPLYDLAHNNLGFLLGQLDRLDEALVHCRIAVRIDPSNVEYHHSLGFVFEKLSKHEEALEAFNSALVIDPKHAPSHYGRGNVLHKMNKFNEALEAYDEAIECDSELMEAIEKREYLLSEISSLH